MRIAQVAPLYEPVPPPLYGGTERVVANLTDELVQRGHEVTLFASADSTTRAKLEPMVGRATRLRGARDPLPLHIAMLEEVYSRAEEFDVIHSHVDVLAFPFARSVATPTLTTMHGRLDFPEHRRVLGRFRDLPLASISEAQRQPVSDLSLNWLGTVYNGVRAGAFHFRQEPDNPPYLVFLGRISPEKGPERAIEIARRARMPLKIGAKLGSADDAWAREHFFPLLKHSGIDYLGEVDDPTKAELLAGATALLFPIDWPEPFGMVMIESMACGTPVVAFPGGAVAEIVVHGETGFICRNVDEAVRAIKRAQQLNRLGCREHVEQKFSSTAMADGYLTVYQSLIASTVSREHGLPEPAPRQALGQPLVDIAAVDGRLAAEDGFVAVPG